MNFIIATNNPNKCKELERILLPFGIHALTQKQAGVELDDVEETGSTFAENSALKARAACKKAGIPAIADDSGLMVDALDGAPGIYSARYAGENGTEAQRIEKLLKNLRDVPYEKRTARFVCDICCVFCDGTEIHADGVCEGHIAFEPSGDGGFGYDPVFVYDGKSFAQLTKEEKDAVSHRGNALRKFSEILPKYINKQPVAEYGNNDMGE